MHFQEIKRAGGSQINIKGLQVLCQKSRFGHRSGIRSTKKGTSRVSIFLVGLGLGVRKKGAHVGGTPEHRPTRPCRQTLNITMLQFVTKAAFLLGVLANTAHANSLSTSAGSPTEFATAIFGSDLINDESSICPARCTEDPCGSSSSPCEQYCVYDASTGSPKTCSSSPPAGSTYYDLW